MAVMGEGSASSSQERDSVSILELEQRLIFTASSNSSRRGRGSILLKELEESTSSTANDKVSGAVPFKWEAEPGKPKSPITRSHSSSSSSSLPSSPLQPPPCLSRDSSRRSQQQVASQNVSPKSLSEKLLQLKPSPSQTRNLNLVEHRLSPVSILDHSYAASPGSSADYSPAIANTKMMTSNISDSNYVESPLSSSQFKKQLSLEIWERSMREQESSGGGCGFFKQMFGCWGKFKPKESPLQEVYGGFQSQGSQQFALFPVDLEYGEFERFQDEELDNRYEDEDESCMVSEAGIEEEEDSEVHAVKDGEFATLPVSATFTFSKPALKKSTSTGTGQQKRVRFFIEDYSSNEEDGEGDVYDCGTSSDDEHEGFQRPARVVIRRRKRTSPREQKLPAQENGSPELQPMQVFRL